VTETLVDGDLLDRGEDGLLRCFWGGSTEEYRAYHDNEWGRPVRDDTRLFEKICLEGFQSGLSWLTILRKRENFRAAFCEFDVDAIASFGEAEVERLLQDAGIVRHRGKIESTINNARRCLELRDGGESLANLVWGFAPEPEARPETVTRQWLMEHPQTAESAGLSKELKRRGWSFVGPTTMYAFMQSVGVVDDHQAPCHVRTAVSG
jgi:DNA-3-methyladenine glycosylase I